MKKFENKQVYDCPKIEPVELTIESTILDTSGEDEQWTPKPSDPIF